MFCGIMEGDLTETLMKYQSAEEADIQNVADSLNECDKKLFLKYYESFKVTKEDLSRKYTPAEVRQLCLRTKVCVNMTLYNCLWDAKKRLGKRLANRSERYINAMLTKAVVKEMVEPYTATEIAHHNGIRQCELKKMNNIRLQRWSSITSISLHSDTNNNSESLLGSQTQSDIEFNREQQAPEPEALLAMEVQLLDSVAGPTSNALQSEETEISHMDWAQNAKMINSESIFIASEDLETQTQESQSQTHTQYTEDYAMFGTQIPATSTQSQDSAKFI